jgi:hypothetical protein
VAWFLKKKYMEGPLKRHCADRRIKTITGEHGSLTCIASSASEHERDVFAMRLACDALVRGDNECVCLTTSSVSLNVATQAEVYMRLQHGFCMSLEQQLSLSHRKLTFFRNDSVLFWLCMCTFSDGPWQTLPSELVLDIAKRIFYSDRTCQLHWVIEPNWVRLPFCDFYVMCFPDSGIVEDARLRLRFLQLFLCVAKHAEVGEYVRATVVMPVRDAFFLQRINH